MGQTDLKKASYFFKMLWKCVDLFKPNLWINVCNFTLTDFMHDLWVFEPPLAYKPTYIDMDLPIEGLNVADFLNNNTMTLGNLSVFLGGDMDWSRLSKFWFTSVDRNYWVWFPYANTSKVSNVIYNFINQCPYYETPNGSSGKNLCVECISWAHPYP